MYEYILARLAAIQKDKLLHFAVAIPIYLFSVITLKAGGLELYAYELGFVCVVFGALVKEAADYFSPNHTSDFYDFVATASGGLCAFLCSVI